MTKMPMDRSPIRTRSQIERLRSDALQQESLASPTITHDEPPRTTYVPHTSTEIETAPPRVQERAPSVRSTRSVEARIRQRQLEAEESLAQIQRDEYALQRMMIKKRLAADVALIQEETDRESFVAAEELEASQHIEDWLDQSHARGERPANNGETEQRHRLPPRPQPTRERETERYEANDACERSRRRRSPSPLQPPRPPSPHRQDRSSIDRMADMMERMYRYRAPPRQTQELPIFSGAFDEWLPFKAAMRESTKLHRFSAVENLARLRTCLKGEARQVVSALLYSATDPEEIMEVLEQCFGTPEMIIDHALEDLKKLPRLSPSMTAAELNSFAIKVQNVVTVVNNIDQRGYLQNPMLARQVTDKLTAHLKSKWCDYVEDHGSRSEPEIVTLSQFLMREARRAMRHLYTANITAPLSGNRGSSANPGNKGKNNGNQRNREGVYATTNSQPTEEKKGEPKKKECFSCGGEHDTPKCHKIAAMSVQKRWDWVKEQGLCFICINSKHRRFRCKNKKCGVNECRRPHHALLHSDTPRETEREKTQEETVAAASAHLQPAKTQVLLKVCPVTIKGQNGKEVNTYALLDEGSTITLVDDEIAGMIGSRGPHRPLHIHGATSSKKEPESQVIELRIKGRTQDSYHPIHARTVKNLMLRSQSVDKSLLEQAHLQELRPEHVCYAHGRPRILIGADYWHLIVTRRLLAGLKNQPAASLTQLGWIVHGTTPRSIITKEDEESVLHIRTIQDIQQGTMREGKNDEDLHELVKAHFDLDALGISQSRKPNAQEERAREIFERTAQRVDGRFEVGLPWKTDDVTLPPSYTMAVNRLRGIERKMDRCPQFRDAYTAEVSKLFEKGYATLCEQDHADDPRLWYLPHFAVTNPNKPGRVRMVFDAAAKANGMCLNDALLDGPDLLRALNGILLKFRMKPIAVVADIREMFLRVKIRKEDCVAQHFLWRGDERTERPQKYVMTSMIFGARSSPFMAHSVRNKNATEFRETHPLAYRAILENHYMDDWVDSFDTMETASRAIHEVVKVHRQAGFHMAGWVTSEPELLTTIPEEDRAIAPRELGAGAYGKTLGLLWIPHADELAFNVSMHRVPEDVKQGTRTPTKREVLGAVMSIYDPLGLVSPYSVSAKIMLQGLWKKQLGWDEELPEEEAMEFANWLHDLKYIERLRLPRCYMKDHVAERELHVFCDASDQAYACAVYWRLVATNGDVRVILIAGKAKVAPLRPQSIPRMELQAALIGARLATEVRRELELQTDVEITYWSDSKTVIQWIRNDAVRYTPFVAHRLSEIAELTAARDWRWLPTAHNVADDATRAGRTQLSKEDRWFCGPEFLYRPREDWPQETTTPPQEYNEEVIVNHTTTESPWIDMKRFSKYERLVRAVGYVLLFTEKCRRRARELTSEHLTKAERLLIKQAQREAFEKEIERLKKGKPVERSSRLCKLDPIMNDDGILRLNGRIRNAAVPEERKYPPILDGGHHLTKLIIRREHEENSHVGRETVVNNIRQRYWVIRLRPTVRSVLYECARCRARKARPAVPVKGDLPEARLSAYTRPFSRCGIDCFGPMVVTIGRRREKRWGMLFTCLVSRGIHIELLSSLGTDSAIMAMRRMAARRGWAQLYYSDNGTNFHGADVELKTAYREWLPELKNYVLLKRADWRYIDPGAPNQGGAWERMIRTVKNALSMVLQERAPKEEVLSTLMAEVEYTVNSRPLGHVSVSEDAEETLTPNHFLLGSGDGLPYVGKCDVGDKRAWRATQALANMFWARWLKEYLPTLAPRGECKSTSANSVKVGDLVVVADGLLPRNLWPRGRVQVVHPGKDGIVRSAEVQTRGGVFRRPVRRLIVLPRGEEAA